MARVEVHEAADAGGDYESTPTARLVLAWAVVGIPLIYGVTQVFLKSLALFQ